MRCANTRLRPPGVCARLGMGAGGQAAPSEGLPGPARRVPAWLTDAAGACTRASCCVGPQGLPGPLARARLSGQRSGPQLGAELVPACSFVGSVAAYRLPLRALADGLPEEGPGGGARRQRGRRSSEGAAGPREVGAPKNRRFASQWPRPRLLVATSSQGPCCCRSPDHPPSSPANGHLPSPGSLGPPSKLTSKYMMTNSDEWRKSPWAPRDDPLPVPGVQGSPSESRGLG